MIIVKTPLRLSFVGGGSDMKAFYVKKDGMVLCSAIDKFVYAIVKERFDDMIYINYSKKECVDHVDKIQHDLVREAMKMTGVSKGIEITTLADIPSTGSGFREFKLNHSGTFARPLYISKHLGHGRTFGDGCMPDRNRHY